MKRNKTPKKRIWPEIAGWLGAGAIIAAYALVSFGLMQSDSIAYQLLNLLGAAGIIIISAVKHVRQTVLLNVFWAVIALSALVLMLV